MESINISAAQAGTIVIGDDLAVNRLGFGSMRLTGPGIWGEPADREEARAVLRRAVELGTNFIDTADSYGPHVSENVRDRTFGPTTPDPSISKRRAKAVCGAFASNASRCTNCTGPTWTFPTKSQWARSSSSSSKERSTTSASRTSTSDS